MVEPFKNFFNETVIRSMAGHLSRTAQDTAHAFDGDEFIAFALDGLDGLELKQRSSRLTDGLECQLPDDFGSACDLLVASLNPSDADPDDKIERGIKGWPVMAMADYVARHGQNHVGLSLEVLKQMTSRFTSEFAIRPFLHNHPGETLKTLATWTQDQNHHVRRLVSEGSRPRLPWGMQLKNFVKDPSPVVALLENLKDDPSEYVRRSVANNLNDISKDHADLVGNIAVRWMSAASPARQRLVRHGLRSLIKAGHRGALHALGYDKPKIDLKHFSVLTRQVKLGQALEFDIALSSASQVDQPLIIDYAVHHMRANGKTSPKVFKWKNTVLKSGTSLNATRRHMFRLITTRRYYPGRHRVELMINGQSFGSVDFQFDIE
ncbi:MAG: hypothetical protein JKY27_02140 [Magnetovibrio sp.]|nr:hypothetical protein [Magnetovibrio sp.]